MFQIQNITIVLMLVVKFSFGCAQSPEEKKVAATKTQSPKAVQVEHELLFDGKSLNGWELTSFGGEGDCEVKDGAILMEVGDPLTAINLLDDYDLPTKNYELLVEAKRVEGSDFFATITFPVEESFCSLVVGGWAGTLVGLSSIDGEDASMNETRKLMDFEDDRWYRIRLRIAKQNISAWIDDQQVVNFHTVGRKISLRGEMIPCRPLGIASFYSTAAIRKVELTRLANKTDVNRTGEK